MTCRTCFWCSANMLWNILYNDLCEYLKQVSIDLILEIMMIWLDSCTPNCQWMTGNCYIRGKRRSEVFMAGKIHVMAFWVITLCCVVSAYRYIAGILVYSLRVTERNVYTFLQRTPTQIYVHPYPSEHCLQSSTLWNIGTEGKLLKKR